MSPGGEQEPVVRVEVSEAVAAGRGEALERLVAERVASRTASGDATVWGPEAEAEASKRLGWTRLHETSRGLPAEIAALRGELLAEGVDRVVLAGMGGSSLAPEVVCAAHGVPLVTLDATDPGQVRDALVELERTVVVVSSKSGGTVETDSQRRAFVEAFEQAGIDPARRVVVVTDPGSPLETAAREAGYRAVFLADPEVGGRYSALTAFGLVPSGLAGADVDRLLDEAAAVAGDCARDDAANPALQLAAAMAAVPSADGQGPRDKLVLVDDPAGALPGLPDWAEQLVAESTGKEGVGVLPVVVPPGAPEVTAGLPDAVVVRCAATHVPHGTADVEGPEDAHVVVTGPLGAQLLLWEHATAAAGFLLGINPFDQPDVESAKQAARGLLESTPAPREARSTHHGVDVVADDATLGSRGADGLDEAVEALLGHLGPHGYLAVMVYLDRLAHADLAGARDALAARSGRPVTFGWGPRFLHSTGQLHKGGPPVGVFLQVVGDLAEDLPVPGRDFTFGRLKAAQADGDAGVLRDHDRPVLTLRVRDAAGLAAVDAALRGRAG
ncbi:glucose-6-phosphate isomerase [Aquipuribacter nitratireducens]|uniref:Glucose-6-phosphate isomerase n=1 Tax=Aquipuribacter nitratireducens TaxID=650104 RepID=A0ABW0GKH1_9MICO